MDTPPVDYGKVWEQIIIGKEKQVVCFSHGTCVVFTQPQQDLKRSAIDLMKEWGPVHAACSAGDFTVVHLKEHPGWVVTSHHNDILTYVDPSEGEFDAKNDVGIGLHGRSKRDMDATELQVVHVKEYG